LSLVKYLKKVGLAGFSYLPSELKIFIYRGMGAKIGKSVELGLGSYIIPFDNNFKKIQIEDGVIIEDGVHILSRNLLLGKDSQIKDNTNIWGQSDFFIGKGVYIDKECHFDLRRNITLGNEVVISGGSWLYTHMIFHSVLKGSPSKFGPITIEERTYLGANAFVLPDITIGHDAIIGARAVVTKNVKPDSVMVGNPAREIAHTSQKVKKLTREDKNIIVKNILNDFVMIYDENICTIENKENCCIIKVDNLHVFYLSTIENFSLVERILRKYNKPLTLVSFEIPDAIKEMCSNNDVMWIDLETGTKSLKTNKTNRILEKFFGNYGIKIS